MREVRSISPVLPDVLKTMTLDKKSKAYRRANYAGFKIYEMTAREGYWLEQFSLELPFECVCGRKELFHRSIPKDHLIDFLIHDRHFRQDETTGNFIWDGVLDIEHLGAFSAEHLRRDGYTEEQIKDIRYIYDLEEEVKILKRDQMILQYQLSKYEPVHEMEKLYERANS